LRWPRLRHRQRLEQLGRLLFGQRRPSNDIRQTAYVETRQIDRVIARFP